MTQYTIRLESGRLAVEAETDGMVHRSLIEPGENTAAGWVPANLSSHPVEVQEAAAELWTAEVVDAFKQAHPYVAPPPSKTFGQLDQEALNDALVASGSVVRALGLVMFAEINKLRVKNGDTAYTLNQFKSALLAQMR